MQIKKKDFSDEPQNNGTSRGLDELIDHVLITVKAK